jgi:excinuclease ABC subunit C
MAVERVKKLREQAAALPLVPGVYQFVDASGTVLYVGKAKSLRKRVANYFAEARVPAKIRAMVRSAVEIRHIVVDSETDALLLENSLIKTLQPRYNAMLKDDKTYPWIVIKNEPFPRVRSTRQLIKDGSQYFGPYGSISVQRNLLEIIHAIYQFRTCGLNLAPEEIVKEKYRPCLEYHLGNCKAPCVGLQTEADYATSLDMARAMLKGELGPTRRYLRELMREAAEDLRFEVAAEYKHRLDLLENYSGKSVVASTTLGNLDVFALIIDSDVAYCNFVRTVRGNVVNSFTVRLLLGAEDDPRQILTTAISRTSEELSGPLNREVVVPWMPEQELFPDVKFTVPKRGDKLKLLEFAEKNARMYRAEVMKNMEVKDPAKYIDRVMEAMQRELRLPREPRHIECFDNSNLGGTHPVASCVVFRDGKPSRKEYRHYNVKTVVGPDDFASMREIVHRRYSRLLREGVELPDLVVVDGGKGQLSAAWGIFVELGIDDKVPLVGLAKRIEEVFYPGDPMPFYLKRNGEPLKVMTHIRDEAHRFGITFHRNKRSAAFIHSELEYIPGIGSKTIETLLKRFKTVSAVRSATEEELAAVVGAARSRAIKRYFEGESE